MGQSSSTYQSPPSTHRPSPSTQRPSTPQSPVYLAPAQAVSPHPIQSPTKRLITATSIRPMDMDGRRALEQAVQEMKECREVFASWRSYIDSSASGRPSDIELQIRSYVDRLDNSSLNALRETENIVRAHMSLGVLMERRLLNDTSHDGSVTLQASNEVITIIGEIQRRSQAVSEYANGMKETLRGLVDVLERGVPQKKKSLSQRLFGWLKKIFHIVAGVLAALSAASLTVFHLAAPALVAGAALASAAASIAGDFENGSPADLERLIAMLRETIPAQAAIIAQKLSNFQYCHLLLQNEMEMQKGAVYSLSSQEAANARLQWAVHNTGMQLIRP